RRVVRFAVWRGLEGGGVAGGVQGGAGVVRVGWQQEGVAGLDVVGVVGVPLSVLRVQSGDLGVALFVAEEPAGDVPHPVALDDLVGQLWRVVCLRWAVVRGRVGRVGGCGRRWGGVVG